MWSELRYEEVVRREHDSLVRDTARQGKDAQFGGIRDEPRGNPTAHEVEGIGSVPPLTEDSRIIPGIRLTPEPSLERRDEILLEDRLDARGGPREAAVGQSLVHRGSAIRFDEALGGIGQRPSDTVPAEDRSLDIADVLDRPKEGHELGPCGGRAEAVVGKEVGIVPEAGLHLSRVRAAPNFAAHRKRVEGPNLVRGCT